MQLSELTPNIGSEVRGLDLGALDDIKAGWLRKQLFERQVLVVRDQHHAVWDYYPNNRYAERVSVIGSALRAA